MSADQIEILPDGRFFHLGRADNVLKIGGTRISVAEIEKRILSIPGVSDAYVDAIPTDGPRQYLIRALVAAQNPDGSPLSPQAIRQALSAWLEPVMLPRRIIVLKSLPRESTGKIRRETVEALFQTKKED
ncbi:MAG: hypothetical protein RMJ84_01705 [Sandaracinaceae bacterium]|nr:hypothetical protein [Sandaracinaceae bacterium]